MNVTPVPADSASFTELKGKRALICEDEAITQLQVRMMLRRNGLEVVGQAVNGEEAVDLALSTRPDIILMDIKMPPGIDGLEASRKILSNFETCIVLLTANNGLEAEAEKIGTCGYLLKPVDSRSLMPALAGAYQVFQNKHG